VYTNVVERVPLTQRERGKLDLSRISLNSELGTALSNRLKQEHRALRESAACDGLLEQISMPPLLRLWDQQWPLVVGAGALLLFALYIPGILRRFGVSLPLRMLAFLLPFVALSALLAHGLGQTDERASELRKKAAPCMPETFDELRDRGAELWEQAELVRSLKRLVSRESGGS
jgi:hypothetical protein